MIVDHDDWNNEAQKLYWVTRPSDWMTDHFRIYNEATGDPFWLEVIDTIYSVFSKFSQQYSPTTGLISDFVGSKQPEPYEYVQGKTYYSYDACRVPWRIATDFAHNNSPEAKEICKKIASWIRGKYSNNPWKLECEYELNGTAKQHYNTTAFTSPFLAACMADASSATQNFIDEGIKVITEVPEEYYEDSINLLCMLLLSGNWWRPEAPTRIEGENSIKNYSCFSLAAHSIRNSITVSFSLQKAGSVRFDIYTAHGKLIHTAIRDYTNQGNHTMTLNINAINVANGIYLGDLAVNGETAVTRFSVVK